MTIRHLSARQAIVAVAAAALAVWILLLPSLLVEATATEQFAWVMLDLSELGALLGFLYAGLLRLSWVDWVARLAAGLFVADAVVDLSTSAGAELTSAVAMAVGAELPLALICLREASRLRAQWAAETQALGFA